MGKRTRHPGKKRRESMRASAAASSGNTAQGAYSVHMLPDDNASNPDTDNGSNLDADVDPNMRPRIPSPWLHAAEPQSLHPFAMPTCDMMQCQCEDASTLLLPAYVPSCPLCGAQIPQTTHL